VVGNVGMSLGSAGGEVVRVGLRLRVRAGVWGGRRVCGNKFSTGCKHVMHVPECAVCSSCAECV
jgi:hypothetical protein